MPTWILLAQEHASPEVDPRELGEHANLAAAFWAWGIFLVLLFVLWWKAWGPIAKGLDARAARIEGSLKKAEEVEKAARDMQETNRQMLAKAQQDAQALVAEARQVAKNAADDVLAKAQGEIEAQRERFVRETQMMVEKARADLRRDTVDLTIEATTKLLGRTLTQADTRRLAEQALADAEKVARN